MRGNYITRFWGGQNLTAVEGIYSTATNAIQALRRTFFDHSATATSDIKTKTLDIFLKDKPIVVSLLFPIYFLLLFVQMYLLYIVFCSCTYNPNRIFFIFSNWIAQLRGHRPDIYFLLFWTRSLFIKPKLDIIRITVRILMLLDVDQIFFKIPSYVQSSPLQRRSS